MTADTEIARVVKVEPLEGFELRVTFDDGFVRDLDFASTLWGPVFEPLRRDINLFRQVRIDEVAGTIAWPNGADLDPDVLRGRFEPAA